MYTSHYSKISSTGPLFLFLTRLHHSVSVICYSLSRTQRAFLVDQRAGMVLKLDAWHEMKTENNLFKQRIP